MPPSRGVIDRYVNGEAVPYPELRKVWSDTSWFPTQPCQQCAAAIFLASLAKLASVAAKQGRAL